MFYQICSIIFQGNGWRSIWRISVEYPGELPPPPTPLFLDQTEAKREKKFFFETTPSLISGSG